jgi:NosR/NirI family transcriptional regulator, nitrous oxide reductase regulator
MLFAAGWLAACHAGEMTHAELVKRFPPPLIVGAKDAAIPVWPLFKQNATANELVGYVFESIDLAPVPGFSGVPINLLITLDPKGTFLGVQVLSQHEPVFLDGLGEAPLLQFASQYRGLSLNQNIQVGPQKNQAGKNPGAAAHLDGITKATASVRILHQSVLAAALKVARKKLGFAEGRDPDRIAQVKSELFEPHSTRQLIERGLLQHLLLRNRDVEQQFAAGAGAGLDPEALQKPDDVFIDLYLAYVSVPSIGRNLLQPDSWARLGSRLEPGDHALLVLSKGRYSIAGDEFIPGTVPERLLLQQDRLPIEMRDLNLELALAEPKALPTESMHVLRIISQSGLDPSQPLDFTLPITRNKGIVYPQRLTQNVTLQMRLPARFYQAAERADNSWRGIWKSRWQELALLLGALTLLTVALSRQAKLTANSRHFSWFRRGFLLFTLLFIGWYAQGQLSIVNLTGALQALLAGRSLGFFLYDPMTVLLWGFVAVSLLVWGRGTFCGWLCPFGALQEFTGKLGQALHLPQWKISARADAWLKLLKYVLLAAILVSAFFSASITETLVEIEPFKTAITLNFVRSWPYVVYAVALLVVSGFSYKFYCRYVCPFGAGLALFGRLRLLNWLPRRQQCGTPCQSCRHQCEYHAIKPDGGISYPDCFQCMDCVVIYHSDQKCAPLMLEKKRARVIPVKAVATEP